MWRWQHWVSMYPCKDLLLCLHPTTTTTWGPVPLPPPLPLTGQGVDREARCVSCQMVAAWGGEDIGVFKKTGRVEEATSGPCTYRDYLIPVLHRQERKIDILLYFTISMSLFPNRWSNKSRIFQGLFRASQSIF